jgi:hypothetical protein
MRRLLQLQEILIDYDGPQLWLARDQFQTPYLCLWVESLETLDKHLCVPVTPQRLQRFYQGLIDLRTIYEQPESEELFYAEVGQADQDISLIPLAPASLLEEWLPEPDWWYAKPFIPSSLEPRPRVQLSEEQIQGLLELLQYKPLLEQLSSQVGKLI